MRYEGLIYSQRVSIKRGPGKKAQVDDGNSRKHRRSSACREAPLVFPSMSISDTFTILWILYKHDHKLIPSFPPVIMSQPSHPTNTTVSDGAATFKTTTQTAAGFSAGSLLSSSSPWHLLLGFLPLGLSSVFVQQQSASGYVLDSLKLVILGTLLELGRRVFLWAMERFRFREFYEPAVNEHVLCYTHGVE